MFSRVTFPLLALAASSLAAITYKGYDLSSLNMMEEDEGATFYTPSGSLSTAEAILGGNSARLRLWVDSAGQYNLNYTVDLAARLHAENYNILLDIFFSDTWTDPTNQAIPSSWPTGITSLSKTIQSYVSSTLQSFSDAGVDLSIVSLGNEITSGILFPTGQISDNDFGNFATLLAAARAGVTDAVSAGVTKPKVMLHLDDGWNEETQLWWYKSLIATGTVSSDDFDIMGVSFYPYYGTDATIDNLQSSLNSLASTYGKPVMVVETDWPVSCSGVSLSNSSIPVSAAGQTAWVSDIISVLDGVPNSLGQGLFYFEPAYINNTALSSDCKDVILFDVDWTTWPATKVTARSSASLFA